MIKIQNPKIKGQNYKSKLKIMSKLIITAIIVAIVIGSGAFYGGMKYVQSNSPAGGPQGFSQSDFEEFRNLSPEERQERFEQMGSAGMIGMRGARPGDRTGSGFANGEIILKDESSITVKLLDGGSKIVFYSDSTEVGKFTSGSPDDLEIGNSVMINGKANEDGSITAQSIQIRPEMNSTQ